MENLNADCIANVYGDKPSYISSNIWLQIRNIVKTLYEKEGIGCIDITSCNFIEVDINTDNKVEKKIYIIDFVYAYYTHNMNKQNSIKNQN